MVKKKLSKAEEKTIERKIAYWCNQEELDKINYMSVYTHLYGLLAIFIALWIGITTSINTIFGGKYFSSLTFFILFSTILFITLDKKVYSVLLREEKNIRTVLKQETFK